MESKKIKKQIKKNQIHKNKEQAKLLVATGEGSGGMGKMDEGSERYRILVMELIIHGDERLSIGNIVNRIVIALHGNRWELHL